jgi:hypothetical protein
MRASAKIAATKLRLLIADLLKTERDQALATLETLKTRLRALQDFGTLTEPARQEVLAANIAARNAINSARFVTGIRDRLQRYTIQDYPAQLALISRLVAPAPKAIGDGGQAPTPTPPPVIYMPATSLRPKCDLPYIATESDLDLWLAALRAVAQAELDKGNRISL